MQSTADIVSAVRDAATTATPLRIAGGGSWLDAGHPVPATTILDLGRLRGIVEYNPGDLTLTALAGTTLAEIDEACRSARQWLPFDAPGDSRATLGAVIATASCGPLAASIGLPRDVVLGVQVVTGTGDLVRGGGRVVKNVAGFDLTRLMTGAWGTLGVLTEVSVRLRAQPLVDETVVLPLPDDPETLALLLRSVRTGATLPVSAELMNGALAQSLGLGEQSVLAVRLMGNEEAVAFQRNILASLGSATTAPGSLWPGLRTVEAGFTSVVRLSNLPSRIAETWDEARRACGAVPETLLHATVERGVVRAILPTVDPDAVGVVLRRLESFPNMVPERLPASLWRPRPNSGTRTRLLDGVRQAFDPDQLLNRGILGEATT